MEHEEPSKGVREAPERRRRNTVQVRGSASFCFFCPVVCNPLGIVVRQPRDSHTRRRALSASPLGVNDRRGALAQHVRARTGAVFGRLCARARLRRGCLPRLRVPFQSHRSHASHGKLQTFARMQALLSAQADLYRTGGADATHTRACCESMLVMTPRRVLAALMHHVSCDDRRDRRQWASSRGDRARSFGGADVSRHRN